MITRAQLLAVMPNSAAVVDRFLRPLSEAMNTYAINTPARRAAFLAQLAHESAELRRTQENLNYSWDRLRKVFPRYFRSDAEAQAYDRQPERIANRVYANRMLNGDETSGDGWRFRGRGPIQVTGRENYRKIGQALGINLESDPDRLLDPATGCLAAAWYWNSRGLNSLADADAEEAFRETTRRINGGFIGLQERIHFWERARQALGLPGFGPVMARRMGSVRMPPGTPAPMPPEEEFLGLDAPPAPGARALPKRAARKPAPAPAAGRRKQPKPKAPAKAKASTPPKAAPKTAAARKPVTRKPASRKPARKPAAPRKSAPRR
jgi:putative chitinase